jgi:hypothetical protein
MSDIEQHWDESGRGMAPHQRRVAVTAATRVEEAFSAYNRHLSICRDCAPCLESGGPLCDEAKRLGDVYLAAEKASRAERATSSEGS